MLVVVRRSFSVGLVLLCALLGAPALMVAPALAAEPEPAQGCPNEQLRSEQPFGLTLPDCRAYEMVSPVEANGQDATDPTLAAGARAAVSSEAPAITYTSNGDFGDPIGSAATNQFVSRRDPGNDRWETQPITPRHEPLKTESEGSYAAMAFTPGLTRGIAQDNGRLTPEAPAKPGESEEGMYVADFEDNTYQYVADAPDVEPLGASTDLSHVVFGDEGTVSEWVDGRVVTVSVTNDAGHEIGASVGDAALNLGPGEGIRKDVWHAVSADGSRVYFTSPAGEEEGAGQLYLRVNPEARQSGLGPGGECTEPALACTIEIPPGTSSPGAARYWGASADGTKVFFTKAEDLYEYSLPLGQVAGGQTTAITKGGEVQGVVQISEVGSYVYFVAKGALKGEHGEALRNASGVEPVANEDNLYVSHVGGAPAFVATLAAGDELDWGQAGSHEGEAGPELNKAVVTPDGSRLAFLSEKSLTGYDNVDANSPAGEPHADAEIYIYDATSDGLVCASCDPSGARPLGPASLNQRPQSFSEYRPRNFTADGTLFFDSADELVPQANDGRQNVYEYENGRVHAISNVAGGYESFFLDASADGEDVFFASADDLLAQDTANNVVVWDARAGGGFPATPAAPSCDNGDSCKPPPAAQPSVFAPTGSATFSGPGDTTPPVVKPAVKKKTVKKHKRKKRRRVRRKTGKSNRKGRK